MTTITCAKTGIVFEAVSARQKNHPAISAALNSADRDGCYRDALDAISAGKIQGFTSVDEFVTLLRNADARSAAAQAFRDNKVTRDNWIDGQSGVQN